MTASRPARRTIAVLAATLCLGAAPAISADKSSAVAHPALWPRAASPKAITNPATERFITKLMATMSLDEKVGQVIQGDLGSITPEDLRKYPLGSILAGGNSSPGGDERAPAAKWLELNRAFRAVAAEARPGHAPIPLMLGIDAVHGHNNIVGATIFPHNIGLGAARDPDLIRRIGEATAQEVAATGFDWTFGPTLATPRDVRWGRSYEGYAEDPEVVRAYAGPMTLGLQGPLKPGAPLALGHIAGSAKHFLADGGTSGGKDQGDAAITEAELIGVHAQGYPPAIDAGILTVMASFSSWNGAKLIANESLLTGVLKGRMGFQGFTVGDWNAHGQVPGCSNVSCAAAMKAGLDMYMAPDSWKGLYENTLAQAKSGEIPMARLDDAVRRILRVKVKTGLFRETRPFDGRLDRLGAPDHRALAREAVRKSLVLLKNDGVLPIKPHAHILVAGDGADDIGKQSGGWTITWQGTGNRNADFPKGQSIYAGLAEAAQATGGQAELAVDGSFKTRPDVAVVVFGEDPYAEFQGDIPTLEYHPGDKKDLALIRRLRAQGIPVVAVFLSGRPLWTNPEINASSAFVAAWLPGSEGEGVADVLVAGADGKPRHDFTGRLSFSWPKRADQAPLHRGQPGYDPQFAYGYGLTYAHGGATPQLSEDPGAVVAAVNVERYFVRGRAPAPWSLDVQGGVTLKAVDGGAQEDARLATWTGPGALVVSGRPVDLSRQTTGDMAVAIRYRLDQAPSGPVMLGVGCGAACSADLDVSRLLQAGTPGQWRTAKIKLSCFKAAGARMDRIDTPVRLSGPAGLVLAFSDLRLVTNEGDAVCP